MKDSTHFVTEKEYLLLKHCKSCGFTSPTVINQFKSKSDSLMVENEALTKLVQRCSFNRCYYCAHLSFCEKKGLCVDCDFELVANIGEMTL